MFINEVRVLDDYRDELIDISEYSKEDCDILLSIISLTFFDLKSKLWITNCLFTRLPFAINLFNISPDSEYRLRYYKLIWLK